MKSKILSLIVVVLIIGLGFYYFHNHKAQAPAQLADQTQNSNPLSPSNPVNTDPASNAPEQAAAPQSAANSDSAPHFSNESDIDGGDVMVEEVDFDGKTFTPNSLDIKTGDIVVFKNKSSVSFWPESEAVTGGGVYTEFNAGSAVAPGSLFQFKFTKPGVWGYADHLHPLIKGVIKASN